MDRSKRTPIEAGRRNFDPAELWPVIERLSYELGSAGHQRNLIGLQRVTATILAVLAQLMEDS